MKFHIHWCLQLIFNPQKHEAMKKTIIISLFISYSGFAFCQSRPDSLQHNQIGLDVAYGIRSYLNFNEMTWPDAPEYLMIYRRLFDKGSLRIAGNVSFTLENPKSYYDEDSNHYQNSETFLQLSVGYEWFKMLDKRWQIYYGLDGIFNVRSIDFDLNYYNAGYANGTESSLVKYGLAPLLGLRLYCTPRISLTTETSILIAIEEFQSTRTYIPISSDYPAIENVAEPSLTTIHNIYTPSISLTLNISL